MVVLCQGSVLSRGGRPHMLAVSMDPSAAWCGKSVELGRPSECASRQRVWAENLVCSGTSGESHLRLASWKPKCIASGTRQPGVGLAFISSAQTLPRPAPLLLRVPRLSGFPMGATSCRSGPSSNATTHDHLIESNPGS